MQIPYDLDAQNTTLGYLMHGESLATHGQYYALFRDREFDPNHWTEELSKEVKFIKNKNLWPSFLAYTFYIIAECITS